MPVQSTSLMVSWAPETKDTPIGKRRPSLAQQFNVSTRELQYQTSSFASTHWHVLVGVAAFLDFLALCLASFFPEDDGLQTVVTKGLFFDRYHEEYVVTDDPFLYDVLQWLDTWSVQIASVFSILWCVDAIVKARWKRNVKIDRQRLLENENDETAEAKPWRAFYCSVVFQLLVLPVGFYVAIWNALGFHRLSMSTTTNLQEDECNEDESLNDFGSRSTHSLLFALLHYVFIIMNRLVGVGVRTQRKALTRRVAARMTKFAVRHPRLFRHRLRVSLRTIRWAKYLAPLVGSFNKLLGNTKDLLKKHRQRLLANMASRKRKQQWHELSPLQKRMAAAIRIQKSFRGMQCRKAVRALNILEGSKKTMIAIKMQQAFRASLARARTRIAQKKQELKRLQRQSFHNPSMSEDERRRMYQLQDELGSMAKELVNKKLLLRPNTSFAVTWKFLFVLCVIFEISQKGLKHKLHKYKDTETGEPLDLGRIHEKYFVPAPVSEWEACSQWLAEKEEARGFFHLTFGKKHPDVGPRPWFCQEPVITAHSICIFIVHFILIKFIGFICFLDVFVTFFTGELHPDTGLLVPKAFVKRWLLPGLVLQLLVNPQMETTSKLVARLLQGIVNVGPVRAWRWTAALWYPLLRIIARAVEVNIWRPLVQQQNEDLQKRKEKQAAAQASVEPQGFKRHSDVRLSIHQELDTVAIKSSFA